MIYRIQPAEGYRQIQNSCQQLQSWVVAAVDVVVELDLVLVNERCRQIHKILQRRSWHSAALSLWLTVPTLLKATVLGYPNY